MTPNDVRVYFQFRYGQAARLAVATMTLPGSWPAEHYQSVGSCHTIRSNTTITGAYLLN